MEGFWAAEPYLGLKKGFRYPEQRLTLDRYLILLSGAFGAAHSVDVDGMAGAGHSFHPVAGRSV